MAAVPTVSNSRVKPKKPLDVWSIREKLCLASAVFKIGDQNWVSVSRAIKPYAEPSRPPEWFHQKNCLLQYYDLMEQLEQPKRKRGGEKSESDTPSLQIMRKMTIERSEQLKKEVLEMQQKFKQMKSDIESIKAGIWDGHIEQVWQEIQEEQRNAEAQEKIEVKVEDDCDESKIAAGEIFHSSTPVRDVDESTQDSVGDISVLTDEESTHSGSAAFPTPPPIVSAAEKLSASHLLKLLKSDVKTATELQRLKHEQEQGQQHEQLQQQYCQGSQPAVLPQPQISLLKAPISQDDPLTTSPSCTAPTLSRLLSTAKGHIDGANIKLTSSSSDVLLTTSANQVIKHESAMKDTSEETVIKDIEESNLTDVSCHSQPKGSCTQSDTTELDILTLPVSVHETAETAKNVMENTDAEKTEERDYLKMPPNSQHEETIDAIKEELDKESQDEDEDTSVKRSIESLASEAELTESSIKDEPLSPASSISSKISEAGSKRSNEIRGQSSSQSSGLSTRKVYHTHTDRKEESGSLQHSDVELSEDESRERDDILTGQMASVNSGSILSESYPNSPASLSICSDTEEEKSFKQWKKSIMLVWRAAATHKYANVFLHPVTDDIAPGYHCVVLRPMDLSTIKKNVETGIIRSTLDFQHDMMLMFTNAIMYNSSNHNVFRMAKEMYDDVMQHIEQYVNTQMIIQTSDAKNLRQSRRTDALDKDEDPKKRKIHVDQSETEGKTKKRKTKVEENIL